MFKRSTCSTTVQLIVEKYWTYSKTISSSKDSRVSKNSLLPKTWPCLPRLEAGSCSVTLEITAPQETEQGKRLSLCKHLSVNPSILIYYDPIWSSNPFAHLIVIPPIKIYLDTLLLTYLVESLLSIWVSRSVCPKYRTKRCATSIYQQTETTLKWCDLFVHLFICLFPSLSIYFLSKVWNDWQWLAVTGSGLKLSCTRRRYIDRSHHLPDPRINETLPDSRPWTRRDSRPSEGHSPSHVPGGRVWQEYEKNWKNMNKSEMWNALQARVSRCFKVGQRVISFRFSCSCPASISAK